MGQSSGLKTLSDDDLLRRLSDLIRQSRRAEADIVAHIAEVDARRLYAREATPSMFVWCTDRLGLTEQEAYLRITVARASRQHSVLLEKLRDGGLQLRGIALLARHLTAENRQEILDRASGLSFRKLQELAAELEPKADAPARIRELPTRGATTPTTGPGELCTCRAETVAPQPPARGAAASERPTRAGTTGPSEAGAGGTGGPASLQDARSGPRHRPTIELLAPSRHRVQFTAGDALRDKLERLQALMRTTVPDGDLATIIDVAVTEKLERLEAQRFSRTRQPRKSLHDVDTMPASRHIPAPVRRAVYERDEGRCTYEDRHGRRCGTRERLEFHHHGTAFGKGGEHSVENVRLMCRAHNQLLAERDYGKAKMARYRGRRSSASRVSEPMTRYGGTTAGTADRVSPPP